jgi:hypothetical protein
MTYSGLPVVAEMRARELDMGACSTSVCFNDCWALEMQRSVTQPVHCFWATGQRQRPSAHWHD